MTTIKEVVAATSKSNAAKGGDVEQGDKHPVTGWYLEGFGVPPMPEPVTEDQIEGARLLALDDLNEIFAVDEDDPPLDVPVPGSASWDHPTGHTGVGGD